MYDKILRLPAVKDRTGLSRSTIYDYMKQKNFPASICLGPRSRGWIESEIDEWIQNRIAESRGLVS